MSATLRLRRPDFQSRGHTVHINVICPQCKNRYQVDPVLLGKKMRCPNKDCRTVFDVVDTSAAPAKPAPAAPAAPDHVSNFLPVEKAENAGPNVADWRTGPPPRGGAAAAPPPPPAKPAKPAKQPARPAKPAARSAPPAEPEPPSGAAVADWRDAPPVAIPGQPRPENPPRVEVVENVEELQEVGVEMVEDETPRSRKRKKKRDEAEQPQETEVVTPQPALSEDEEQELARQKKSRRARRLIFMMIGGLVLVCGVGAFIAIKVISETEEEQAQKAKQDYDDQKYAEASRRYREMSKKFKDSSKKAKYDFYASVCDLLATLNNDQADMAAALKDMEKFLDTDAGSPFVGEVGRDIGQKFLQRILLYLESEKGEDVKLDKLLEDIERVASRIDKLLPNSIKDDESKKFKDQIARIRERVDKARVRKQLIEQLERILLSGKGEGLKNAKDFIRRHADAFPELAGRAEVKQAMAREEDRHLAGVKYTPVAADVKVPPPGGEEDTQPTIILDPSLGPTRNGPAGAPVTALCRGVLYVLDAVTGEVQWAMRVGIDTNQLPIRLPDDRLLVVSADTKTLTAYGRNNQQRLWQYHLGSACLGKPLIVKGRAYLPTVDGKVHEVNLDDGKAVGRFDLGQRLSIGGVHHRGTNTLYFPGDDSCVYALDVTDDAKKCTTILYTNHAAGSLRGEPLILNEEGAEGGVTSYLVLTQANGIDETELKVYKLPLDNKHAEPTALTPQPRVRGWTWFTPRADSEKLICLSDSARLGLFGINQPRHRDPLLFPLIAEQSESGAQRGEMLGVDVSEHLGGMIEGRRGRSLVAHVQGEEMWLLALGRLQRLEIRLDRVKGPELTPRWKKPLDLGSPLLPEQIREDQTGTSLILVTQPLGRPECLVTAIDPEATEKGPGVGDPRIRWQRQLGVVCHGEPLIVGGEVLAMDRAGGLFRFNPDPKKFNFKDRWFSLGDEAVVAAGLETGDPPQLIQSATGTVYAISAPGGTRLLVRQYDPPAQPGGAAKVLKMPEVDLPGRLAGNVILLSNALIAPLDNGKLIRVRLPVAERAMVEDGQNWRSPSAPPDARCQLVPVDDETFLSTDGTRTVTKRTWKGQFDLNQQMLAELVRENRIVGNVLVLPRAKKDDLLRVLIPDKNGKIWLVQGAERFAEKNWDMKGVITAGPFLRGSHVGCVVDKTRLVWFDPSKDSSEPLWKYQSSQPIVGEPREVDGLLVVADSGGTFVGIDPKKGEKTGEGYTLKALVAPATTPVSFGKDRAFAPLTDGTIMMLSLDRLRTSK